jgi:tRNA(Ile)-lysidine synthase TilS/MesJ
LFMARCRVCGRRAEYYVPWANSWFCRDHFIEYIERSVKRTFTRYVPRSHEKILLAISGGKDSLTLLYSLAPYLIGEGYRVSALFIDLGIGGYSGEAYRVVSENTGRLGIPLITVRLRDYGFTIDDVARLQNDVFPIVPCEACACVSSEDVSCPVC